METQLVCVYVCFNPEAAGGKKTTTNKTPLTFLAEETKKS